MSGIGSPARTMAINGAMLYGAGAVLVTLYLLLPHPASTNVAETAGAGAVAWAVTVLLIAGRNWLPASVFPVLTAAGTLLITLLVVADGARPSPFMFLYVWAAVYSFYFYTFPVAMIEAAWVAVASAAGQLVTSSGSFPFFRWLMIASTSIMAGLAVRQLVVQVQSLADRDPVTGVFSRRKYHEEIERELVRARRSGQPICLAMLDLDNFKLMNDAKGHVQGDRHLRLTAQAWLKQLRETDMLARYGGEEFVVILPNCPPEQALLTADRLRAQVPGGETASAGVAAWDRKETATTLLQRADAALYAAKAAGRNKTMEADAAIAATAAVGAAG